MVECVNQNNMEKTMQGLIFFSSIFLFIISGCQQGTDNNAEQDKLQALFNEDWEYQLKEHPEFATNLGDNRYNDRLTDLSIDAINKRKEHSQQMLEKLQKIDKASLSEQDALSYDLFEYEKELEIAFNKYPTEFMPVEQLDGIQLSFPALMDIMPLNNINDYENYISRLKAFQKQINQIILLMEEGIKTNWVRAKVGIVGVPSQIEGQIFNDATESTLYRAFKEFPESISEDERARLKKLGEETIGESIFPSLKKLKLFIEETYLPACREDIASKNLPGGEDYYNLLSKYYTSTVLTPKEIHQIGLEEVARIKNEMEKVIKQTGFKGSFGEFLNFLRTDEQFYYKDEEDLIKGYRDISKRADAELPALFAELPRNTYGVKPFPEFEAPYQTTARYYQGAVDGSRAAYFMVNTYKLDTRPIYEMEALTLHEAVPGHHLQITRAAELDFLPDFRRNAGYTAYVEGWALYAESLGEEMGFYSGPYSKFGQLTYEMWRACRLVVDTGMHMFGWSRERAINYIKDNASKSLNDIIVEIDRYIVWPGQALGYKIGELKIKELRDRVKNKLGELFDIRKFHNAILDDGPLPLNLLERRIDEWIEGQMN
jgi:uncharacterized protein (DUF885 family)